MSKKKDEKNRDDLVGFYRSEKPTSWGGTLSEIWNYDDEAMEDRHNYIQWLFPLNEPSRAVPDSPTVSPEQIKVFQRDDDLQSNVAFSLVKMMNFYGFVFGLNDAFDRAENFAERAQVWLTPGNHNHLRISRIIKCLRLFGMNFEANAVKQAVLKVAEDYPDRVEPKTVEIWRSL